MADRLKVIYADDEPDIRTIVEMALSLDATLEARVVESGRELLRVIDAGWRPDIVLLDLMMPEMSGMDVLQDLRDTPEYADLPVAFVTASARQTDVEHYLKQGADGVITKPFDPLSLARTVREHYNRIMHTRGA